MKRAEAQAISESVSRAYDALERAFEAFGARTSEGAAELCAYYLTDAYIKLGLRVLGPIWEEHPGLNPHPERTGSPVPSPVAHVTIEDLQPVLSALAGLRDAVSGSLAHADAGAVTTAESARYREALVSVSDALSEAATSLKQLAR